MQYKQKIKIHLTLNDFIGGTIMSNLKLYQTMTTYAKKMGGPLHFFGVIAIGGYIVLRTVEAGGKTVIKRLKSKKKAIANTYVVHTQGMSNEGLQFLVGEQFRVLEIEVDAILIEKIGDKNNPYFVTAELLCSISNFCF